MQNISTLDNSTNNEEDPWSTLNVPYAVSEVLVAIAAIIGNSLVILVFGKEKRLRRRTKYYIISLAVADLLVGLLGIPFAILASVGLPRNFYLCLFTVSLLVVLCTISIFCLVAVSVDRYWAILHPMSYSRNVRSRTAIGIIIVCWLAGALVGFLPLLGWNEGGALDRKCLFVEVMDYDYLVFLYFATIIAPAILLAAFYAHIYRVVLKQLRQMVMLSPGSLDHQPTSPTRSSGVMLRVLGAAQKREVKATQNLSIIVLFFIICWIPLYTINCVKAFCPTCEVSPTLTNCCIILSHLNSSFNPFLYAYHLKDFRAALHNLILRNQDLPPHYPNSTKYGDNFHHIQKTVTTPQTANPSLASSKSSIAKNNFTVSFEKIPPTNHVKHEEPNEILREAKNYLWTLTEMPSTSEEENHSANKYLGVENSMFLYVDDTDDDDVFVACDHPTQQVAKSPLKFIEAHRRKSHSLYSLQNLHSNSDYKEGRSFSESYTLSKLSCNSKRNQDIGIALSVTNFYRKLENNSDGCEVAKSYRTLSPSKGFKKIKSIELE